MFNPIARRRERQEYRRLAAEHRAQFCPVVHPEFGAWCSERVDAAGHHDGDHGGDGYTWPQQPQT